MGQIAIRRSVLAGCAATALTMAGCGGSAAGQPVSWQETAVNGRDVTLTYQGSGCADIHRRVHETSNQVRIVLTSIRKTGVCPPYDGPMRMVVTLKRPLGNRDLTGQTG